MLIFQGLDGFQMEVLEIIPEYQTLVDFHHLSFFKNGFILPQIVLKNTSTTDSFFMSCCCLFRPISPYSLIYWNHKLTYTVSTGILLIAHVAFASVAGHSWDAASMQTEISMVLTDVYCLVQDCCRKPENKQHVNVSQSFGRCFF